MNFSYKILQIFKNGLTSALSPSYNKSANSKGAAEKDSAAPFLFPEKPAEKPGWGCLKDWVRFSGFSGFGFFRGRAAVCRLPQ